MTDRLDVKINALVVELLDRPVEPPPFPTDLVVVPPTQQALVRRPGWLVAAAAFLIVLLVGVAAVTFFSSTDETPVVDTTPQGVAAELSAAINMGDLEATLAWFADDAQCVAPGLPTCADLFGFFLAAEAQLEFSSCEVMIEPYLQCNGFMHTSIHDALGISIEDLVATPNFPPAFIVENGQIIQFNFSSPFTGDQEADAALWSYMLESGAYYINPDGVPRFSAEIVPDFLEGARQYTQQSDN